MVERNIPPGIRRQRRMKLGFIGSGFISKFHRKEVSME